MRHRKRRPRQGGQVIIEFLIMIIVILSMMFMFIQLTLGIAWGHYVQYATFMSARALFAAGNSQQDQLESARSVLEKMVKAGDGSGRDILESVAKARKGADRDIAQGAEPVEGAFIGAHPMAKDGMNTRAFGWAEGVQYNFGVRLFLLPIATWMSRSGDGNIQMGSGENASPPVSWKGVVPFTSDTWLGREVSVTECEQQLQRIASDGGIARADQQPFIFDNGC